MKTNQKIWIGMRKTSIYEWLNWFEARMCCWCYCWNDEMKWQKLWIVFWKPFISMRCLYFVNSDFIFESTSLGILQHTHKHTTNLSTLSSFFFIWQAFLVFVYRSHLFPLITPEYHLFLSRKLSNQHTNTYSINKFGSKNHIATVTATTTNICIATAKDYSNHTEFTITPST